MTAENDLHGWARDLLEDGLSVRRPWEGVWWENIATYVGDFWTEWSPHETKLIEKNPKPDYRVRIPVNLAQPVIRTEYAKLVKNRPICDVVPKTNEQQDIKAAEVADKVLNNYAEDQFHMGRVRRRALQWTLMCGIGGVFVDYDEAAAAKIDVMVGPDGSPLFDPRVIEGYRNYYKKKGEQPRRQMVPYGDLRIVPLSPFQWVFDRSVNYIEDAWWVIISEVYDTMDVERRWNVKVEPDDDAIPNILERRLLEKADLTGKLAFQGSNKGAQDLCRVHRLFVKPGHPYFPDGLHFVFTEQDEILRENYTFNHGELPLALMGHVPLPTGQVPMSVLQQVRGPVIELSKTESQLIENRNLMSNPPWVIPKQLKLSDELMNKPGMRLTYTHIPNVPPPAPVQMPQMPTYVENLIGTLREHILEISGQGETSQGRIPPGARSGVAVAYLQEEDDTRLGPTVTEYEEMIERIGYLVLETIAEKYDVPRTVRIYKKHSDPEVLDFVGTTIQGNTRVMCQAGSALPRSKAAKQQYILDLWDRKLEQDPRRVRQMLELADGEPEEWEIDIAQAERENFKMMRGEPVDVKDWYNHSAHHFVHRRFMKSPDFEELDPEIQQEMMAHDEEHTRAEASAQQQQDDRQASLAQAGVAQQDQSGGGGPPPQAGANGQPVPEGPPSQFSGTSPADLMNNQPQ